MKTNPFFSIRKSKLYTRRAVANETGVDYSALVRLETGRGALAAETCDKLAEFYGVNSAQLAYEYDAYRRSSAVSVPSRRTPRFYRDNKIVTSVSVTPYALTVLRDVAREKTWNAKEVIEFAATCAYREVFGRAPQTKDEFLAVSNNVEHDCPSCEHGDLCQKEEVS